MTPNVWLINKETPKKEIENLKTVSPQDNVNKNNKPVEMVQEPELSPFPKGKKERVQPPNKINCNLYR